MEVALAVEERLCALEPSIDKLRFPAFVHALYHACMNDSVCVWTDGSSTLLNLRGGGAVKLCRFAHHFVTLIGHPLGRDFATLIGHPMTGVMLVSPLLLFHMICVTPSQ